MCSHGKLKLNNKIFISIASFMDPLLENTIENMLSTAKYPENLVFGIINQNSKDKLEEFTKKYGKRENFKIISILPEESKGCCWARAQVQMLIDDEMYFMQTDSHHVYVKHWDALSIHMLDQCVHLSKHSKVVLSTYGTPANLPEFKCTHEDTAFYMKCEKFYNIPKVRYVPEKVQGSLQQPRLWHTISAHYLFTHMQWVKDVPYDPELYFDGEEDSLALRSYTRGYDIYYPYAKISYHYYTRRGEKRHSDIDKSWYKINDSSIKRFEDILKGKIKGKFGLGDERTLEDYKEFTQIDYLNKVILTPETHKFGTSIFVKKGFEWKENDKYTFKELENSDDFFLLYDYNRKLYAKLNKLKRTFHVSNDLVKWELIGPNNENTNILVFGDSTFTQDLKTKAWTETNIKDKRLWKFVEKENTTSHYLLYDTSRNIHIRLYKDLSCYEAMWPPENKWVSLYGTPKKPIVLSPKPKIPIDFYFGTSHFSKEDTNCIQWKEFCENKQGNYDLKEIVNNDSFYVLQDVNRKVLYRLFKNYSSLEIQTHEKTWHTLFIKGTSKKPEPQQKSEPQQKPEDVSVIENVDKSFSDYRNSDISIVCFGLSTTAYFEEVKRNHRRYCKFFKFNYHYYDVDKVYDSTIIANHFKQKRYVLSISTKTIFTKLDKFLSIGKNSNSNVFVTSFDDKSVQNHMILFKNITGTSTYLKLFDSVVSLDNKPEGIRVVPKEKLGCNYQNHSKASVALVLHVMKPEQIKETTLKWNKIIHA